jgi:hypothetical protein
VVPVVAPPAVAAPATPAVAYLVLPNRKVFMYPELTTPRLDSDGYLCAVCNDRLLFKDDNRGDLLMVGERAARGVPRGPRRPN